VLFVRRVETFKISQRPYAVDLDPAHMRTTGYPWTDGTTGWYVETDALWFRRKGGTTAACIGYLWDHQDHQPVTVPEFLERYSDGRYGGTTVGRWDGRRYWGSQEPETMEDHLAVLRPMLERYPAVPDGYDGWWTFQPEPSPKGKIK
jgi:hypothetical protein